MQNKKKSKMFVDFLNWTNEQKEKHLINNF